MAHLLLDHLLRFHLLLLPLNLSLLFRDFALNIFPSLLQFQLFSFVIYDSLEIVESQSG